MAYTTIDDPTDFFNTKLFVGNSSTNAITGVGHQPDWTWIKRRDGGTGYSNFLFDAVRGVNKGISSNQTAAEQTFTNGFNSFDSDGFTLGANTSGSTATELNYSGGNYVSWNWKAGGSASSNSDGSITSSVSASTTAGFSIVSYTGTASAGATVGHGLGVKPDMIITKARAIADNWGVYHKSLGATKGLYLNTTNAEITSSAYYNNTEPTSTLVTLGDNEATNDNDTMIMYAFAEKKGFSKFGSYTGNGNADGTFVYLGFRPAWVMVKTTTDAGYNWVVYDNKRVGFNPDNDTLNANETRAEQTTGFGHIDMVSNGFKIRASTNDTNRSGNVFIYMAFAESPFVSSGGIPTTAR